jgi:hypothetical protein
LEALPQEIVETLFLLSFKMSIMDVKLLGHFMKKMKSKEINLMVDKESHAAFLPAVTDEWLITLSQYPITHLSILTMQHYHITHLNDNRTILLL